jgi:hypothetical protein
MPSPSAAFAFKAELSPQANVDAFLEHMAGIDKELAELLRHNLGDVLDTTERDRSEARKRFARCISEALDMPPEEPEGGPS